MKTEKNIASTCSDSQTILAQSRPSRHTTSSRSRPHVNDIILIENDNVLNNSTDVSNLMIEYYVNNIKMIGYDDSIFQSDTFDDIVSTHVNNRSVLYIKDNIAASNSMFCFKIVEPTHVFNILRKFNTKNATSVDNIPPNITNFYYIYKQIYN